MVDRVVSGVVLKLEKLAGLAEAPALDASSRTGSRRISRSTARKRQETGISRHE
jgi:hypothetical protein